MTRIVIDTNVLISGTFWTGVSASIIKLVEQRQVILIVSSQIIEEYDRVMNYEEVRRKVQHHHERAYAIQKIIQLGETIEPVNHIDVIKDDPDDNKFIEAAVEGNVEYIISKDKHLLKVKQYKNIRIVTPEEFLAIGRHKA